MRKDIHGIEVQIGDKVRGFGAIYFQEHFSISRAPIVTVNMQNGVLYFGQLSAASFPTFEIIESINKIRDKNEN